MKFTVSILCLNNLALTKRCLESIFAAGMEDAELIIHDNGSTDGTWAWLESHAATRHHVRITRGDHNEGFIEPNRRALAMAQGEYTILLNNDTIVPPGWLEKLADPFEHFPKAALSGPDQGCSELQANFHGTIGKKEYLEGACLCIKTEIARKIGLFSPELIGAYGEDSDLSLRCRELGYTLHWIRDLKIVHARGATSAMVPQARGWQEANHRYCISRWSHYLRVRTFDHPILIRRADAWGDVLLVTPIIRALHKQRPLSTIWVETNCTDIFAKNPYIERCERRITPTKETLIIDLNGSYEAMTQTSIIDAYIHFTRTMLGGAFTCEGKVPEFFDRVMADLPFGIVAKSIALHAGPVCWRSKEWGVDKFDKLCRALIKDDWKIVLVGANKTAPISCYEDYRGRTDIRSLSNLIRSSALFIGLDSFPLHLAQAVGTPAIGLFGVTSSKFILTAPNAVGIDSDAETAGLRHRVANQREVDDAGQAMSRITVEQVLAKVKEMFP